jgi:hypothetical protein
MAGQLAAVGEDATLTSASSIPRGVTDRSGFGSVLRQRLMSHAEKIGESRSGHQRRLGMPTAGETLFSPAASLEAVQAMGESRASWMESADMPKKFQSFLQTGERPPGVREVSFLRRADDCCRLAELSGHSLSLA